jgi:hypothetical protein
MDVYARQDIAKLEMAVEQLKQTLRDELGALRDRETKRDAAHAALVEILVEAKLVDVQDLDARVAAAAIARRHEVREEMSDSQTAWDQAKGKP